MTRYKKNFDIPRGSNDDIDRLRSNIMGRIKTEAENTYAQPNNDYSYQNQQAQVNESFSNQNANSYAQHNNTYQAPPVQNNPGFSQPQHGRETNYPYNQNRYGGRYNNQAQNANYYNNNNINNNINFSQENTFAPYKESYNAPAGEKVRYAKATHSEEPVVYKPKKRKSAGRTVLTLLIMIALIFGLSWALREFVFQAYEIPSGSMEKTIMTGNMVFAEKITPKIASPKGGDIITFTDPLDPNRVLIKRVIATEGQTVNIKNNKLYVDDEEVDEAYTNGLPTTALKSSKNITYPYKIPDNSVWVMGDNRTNSQDSRYFGPISRDSIIGHALCVYWPFSDAKGLV